MATEKLVVIKEVALTNNCPECFNQNLKLSFYQKHSYGKLVHKTTNEVTHLVQCNTCGSDIYPISWTEDIERMFNYYKKMVVPEKTSMQFTPLLYILIGSLVVLIGVIVYLISQEIISF